MKLVFLRSSPGTVLTLAWIFILQLWLNETQFCPALGDAEVFGVCAYKC